MVTTCVSESPTQHPVPLLAAAGSCATCACSSAAESTDVPEASGITESVGHPSIGSLVDGNRPFPFAAGLVVSAISIGVAFRASVMINLF
jgi:hypothetical protein